MGTHFYCHLSPPPRSLIHFTKESYSNFLLPIYFPSARHKPQQHPLRMTQKCSPRNSPWRQAFFTGSATKPPQGVQSAFQELPVKSCILILVPRSGSAGIGTPLLRMRPANSRFRGQGGGRLHNSQTSLPFNPRDRLWLGSAYRRKTRVFKRTLECLDRFPNLTLIDLQAQPTSTPMMTGTTHSPEGYPIWHYRCPSEGRHAWLHTSLPRRAHCHTRLVQPGLKRWPAQFRVVQVV